MKKKMIIGLACLTAGIGLAGCAGSYPVVLPGAEATTTVSGTTTAIEETTTTILDAESLYQDMATTESTTTETVASTEYDNWHELSGEETNSDGYSIRYTMKISNWFSEDDIDKLLPVWNGISNSEEFDQFIPYKIYPNGKKYKTENPDKTYYAIGLLDVSNETSGFENKPVDFNIFLFPGMVEDKTRSLPMGIKIYTSEGLKYYADSVEYYGHKVFSEKIGSTGGLLDVNSKERGIYGDTNSWGTRPFIMACAAKITPNFPNGDLDPRDIKLQFLTNKKDEYITLDVE